MPSDRAEAICAYLRDYRAAEGVPPSIRDIQAALGISSTSVVTYHLRQLVAAGRVRRVGARGSNRCHVPVGDAEDALRARIAALEAEVAVLRARATPQTQYGNTTTWHGLPKE